MAMMITLMPKCVIMPDYKSFQRTRLEMQHVRQRGMALMEIMVAVVGGLILVAVLYAIFSGDDKAAKPEMVPRVERSLERPNYEDYLMPDRQSDRRSDYRNDRRSPPSSERYDYGVGRDGRQRGRAEQGGWGWREDARFQERPWGQGRDPVNAVGGRGGRDQQDWFDQTRQQFEGEQGYRRELNIPDRYNTQSYPRDRNNRNERDDRSKERNQDRYYYGKPQNVWPESRGEYYEPRDAVPSSSRYPYDQDEGGRRGTYR